MDTDGITNTMMAIRERLMDYFKGSCIQSIVTDSNVHVNFVEEKVRARNRAERWRREFSQPALLSLETTPIASLGKEPSTVTIHKDVMERSPQLRQLRQEMESFLRTYLPAVHIEENEGSVFYG